MVICDGEVSETHRIPNSLNVPPQKKNRLGALGESIIKKNSLPETEQIQLVNGYCERCCHKSYIHGTICYSAPVSRGNVALPRDSVYMYRTCVSVSDYAQQVLPDYVLAIQPQHFLPPSYKKRRTRTSR